MPMVWYIPPLSPVVDVVRDTGYDAEDRGNLFAAIDALRIPVEYLAQLFTAGDPAPVDAVLRRLAAMRSYMRDINLGRDADESIPAAVGMTGEQIYDMYRLLALAKYDERYVIPPAHAEQAHALEELATECSLDYEGGPGMGGSGPFGESSGGPAPIAVENFHMLRERQTSERSSTRRQAAASTSSTGTARAARPGCSHPARRRPTDERRRSRTTSRTTHDRRDTHAWQAQSLLLAYPDENWRAAARSTCCGASRPRRTPVGAPLLRFLRPRRATPPAELAADYVATFDHRKRCCLFLTYYAHGDTRKRGMALLRLKQTYAAAGLRVVDDELPDHLAVVLEFAASAEPEPARALLLEPPRRPRAAPPGAARRCARRGPTCSTPVSATLPAAARRRAGGRRPARRRRGRPRNRSASRRSRRRSTCPQPRAEPPDANAVLLWVVVPVRRDRRLRRSATTGATATTSSAGPPGPRSSTRTGCCGWAVPLFHFGILLVVLGHVGGLLIPESWTTAVGRQRDRLPRGRVHPRHHRRCLHTGRAGHPRSTGAAPSARSSPPPPATTRPCTCCSR